MGYMVAAWWLHFLKNHDNITVKGGFIFSTFLNFWVLHNGIEYYKSLKPVYCVPSPKIQDRALLLAVAALLPSHHHSQRSY